MKPYYEDGSVTIYHADCREVLPAIEGVETCITDPPYGLSFMGKGWDHGVPGPEFWGPVRDALLPGAMCLAFGGTRTFHRLTSAIEDAGFEVRDCLAYLYGSGFPKSLDISKAIDKDAGAEREVVGLSAHAPGIGNATAGHYTVGGTEARRVPITAPATDAAKLWHGWGTALKPSWEPVVLAMKPLDGTFAQNALKHGVAGLNVDGARIPTDDPPMTWGGKVGMGFADNAIGQYGGKGDQVAAKSDKGRWPANLVLDEDAAAMLDEQSGEAGGGFGVRGAGSLDGRTSYALPGQGQAVGYGDSGGASRFFYTAKASRADRGEGNDHPTVKPSDLMKWLVTLTATPTGGTVLDPFMGSGTTIYAAKELGRRAIGIELEERYCEIAAQRCSQEVLAL